MLISPVVGQVPAQGSRRISPTRSGVYTLVASASDETAALHVMITMAGPVPRPSDQRSLSNKLDSDSLASQIPDVYFDFNRSECDQKHWTRLTRTLVS